MRRAAWMDSIKNLGDVIQAEMRRLNFTSARQFADLVGMNNATISRQIDPDVSKRPTPSMDLLLAISEKTGRDFFNLIKIAYPHLVHSDGSIEGDSSFFLELYKDSPEETKRSIRAVLIDANRDRKQ